MSMSTPTVNPEAHTDDDTRTEPGYDQPGYGARRVLRRSLHDRMLTGVAGGIAEYLGVDAMIVRIAFVVLTVMGGAGIPLYLAGLLLIPEEGSDVSIAGSLIESLQSR
jgi:phage shock protein C